MKESIVDYGLTVAILRVVINEVAGRIGAVNERLLIQLIITRSRHPF